MKKILILSVMVMGSVWADWQPNGSVNFTIGFGAGGSTDTLGRVIASEIERLKGWNIIVQNKPGGGGVAMFSGLNKTAKKDGTAIGMGVNTPIQISIALKGKNFPVQVDSLTYVGTVSRGPSSIVSRGDAPYNNLPEFIAWSKKNGGKGIFVSQSPDQAAFIKKLNAENGLNLKTLSVKGGAYAMKALLGGEADLIISTGPHVPMLKGGTVKMIAVTTPHRHAYSPDTKTLKEYGINYEVTPYFFLALPGGTDKTVQDAWADVLDQALQTDAVKAIISRLGGDRVNLGPEGTKANMAKGIANFTTLFGK